MGQPFLLPRPDKLFRRWREPKGKTAVSPQTLQAIIAAYDLQVMGEISQPVGTSRGDHVILTTSGGKKILKRYKGSVSPPAVIHEHSILNHLAQIDFPAPRLLATSDGQTLLQKDGSCFALFDFLDGYFQYHQYLLWPSQTHQLMALSAQALAALHNALKDFVPEGCNPNGFKAQNGERWRDANWYAEQLSWCQQNIADLPLVTSLELQTMRQYGQWAEDILYTLDEELKQAALPRLIIHGDYGPYNLFFQHGRPVVILDFELARLDWRVTDLAKSFVQFTKNRLGFDLKKMNHFLEAYNTISAVKADELRLLPVVWQFLTIRRIIVCWYRYGQDHSTRWLREAQQKIELYQWIKAQQKNLSCLLT